VAFLRRFALVAFVGAVMTRALDCVSFDPATSTEPGDAAPPAADASFDASEPTGGDSGARPCLPAAPPLEESFDAGLGLLTAQTSRGGSASEKDGRLVCDVPVVDSAQAEARTTFLLPTGTELDRAELRFTLADMASPSRGFFELGCAVELRASAAGAFSQVRLELRGVELRLDDLARGLDGAVTDTGRGPVAYLVSASPQTLPVRIDITVAADGSELTAEGAVGDSPVVAKKTPLPFRPEVVNLRCGILNVDAPGDGGDAGGVSFGVKIDDVRLALCRRP